MLTCKYLKPFYIYVKDLRRRNIPNVDEKVDSAFLISFVISTVILVIGVILEAHFGGGICITKPQLVLICIMVFFSLLQLIFVCCKLCCISCCRQLKEQSQIALTDDKVTLKMTEVVDTGVHFKDMNGEDVTVDCVIDSDKTVTLEANLLQFHNAKCTAVMLESKDITLIMSGKANKEVCISFKNKKNKLVPINCVIDETATLESICTSAPPCSMYYGIK